MILLFIDYKNRLEGGTYMRLGPARTRPHPSCYFLLSLFLSFIGCVCAVSAAEKTGQNAAPQPKESFDLILPYKDLTVGQGQEVTMDSTVVNRTKEPIGISLALEGVPKGWNVNFNSSYPSYPIRSVMVQGSDQSSNKTTTVEFKAKVPDNAKPGNYQIKVLAKDTRGTTQYTETMNFHVTSKKVETGGLKLTSQYPVLTTAAGQTLKFTIDLKNETNKPLTASLAAKVPEGWAVRFKPQFGDQQISSIQLKENGTETLSVEMDSPALAEAKQYPVTITARAGAFESTADMKVTLKGVPDLRVATREDTLNTSITAGTKASVGIFVGNAGTAPVRNLNFLASKKPDKWTVDFKPDKIDVVNPGEVREIKAEILAPPRTIAGDYMLTFTPNSPDATAKPVDFRVTVTTPSLWNWVGFGIVGLVVLGLAIVFFRLGRR